MFTRKERLLRWFIGLLVRITYRLRSSGLQSIPERGAALVVANHVTYVDALILQTLADRPVRFVVSQEFYDRWPTGWLFRFCRAIPIVGRREDPARLQEALNRIDETLARGEVVGIFPEGRLTRDGELCDFRRGVEGILERRPVPVVPVALKGLWGSFFSYAGGAPLAKWPRRFWSRIEVVAGRALDPAGVSAASLRATIGGLIDGAA